MNKHILIFSSITYAMKSKDILNNQGINAVIKRVPKNKILSGCGYGILISSDPAKAEDILSKFKIKVIDKIELEDTP